MVLGVLLHHVMVRIWLRGVLSKKGLMMDDDHIAADAAAEHVYRVKRSRRAKRLHQWMTNDEQQMWATCSLLVTESLCTSLGNFCQDERMYAHRLNTGESTDLRVWMPPPRDVEERTIPTLYGVMEGKRKFIRTMENRVVGVLSQHASAIHLLHDSFGNVVSHNAIHEALQCLVLETAGDLKQRFTDPSREGACTLVSMVCDNNSQDENREIADRYCKLPKCCGLEDVDGELKKEFPDAGAFVAEKGLEFIAAWSSAELVSTKPVENGHGFNRAALVARGNGRPSDFHTLVDNHWVGNQQRAHAESLVPANAATPRLPRRSLMRFKAHPAVKVALEVVKKLKKKRDDGCGGNPKFFYLNAERQRLTGTCSTMEECYAKITQAKQAYDENAQVRQIAKQRWQAQKIRNSLARTPSCSSRTAYTDSGSGRYAPWEIGDRHWPVAEETLTSFVEQNSKMGGIRPLDAHRKYQLHNLTVNDDDKRSRQYCCSHCRSNMWSDTSRF